MSDYGIKVAKPGFNVETAADDDLSFSSGFNYLKLQASGSVNLSVGSETAEGTPVAISHNLGYKPATEAFINSTSDVCTASVALFGQPFGWSKMDYITVRLELFNNKIELAMHRGFSSSTWSNSITRTAYYRIYIDEALS